MLRRISLALVTFMLVGVTAFAQPPQGGSPDGFVPLSSLPPGEEMPAAPFVVGAYAFFLLLMLFYLWTIWNRLSKVERDLKEFERRHGGATR
ncbi:MAG: heme exporter protein CcmD [Acidobacteria bacterium]|nr:heme exporter protein CcmD [Acidobacteriota bacterium]